MKALVAFERSGIIRDALIAVGIDAISCDLVPTDRAGPHIQGDAFEVIKEPWDLIIAHPVCKYLANSGVQWLFTKKGRWDEMVAGAHLFREVLKANTYYLAVENSVMHKYAMDLIVRPYNFKTQPWMFGNNNKKASCWWVNNLPYLEPTASHHGKYYAKPISHMIPPSENRAQLRSQTQPGIADAIAQQWGLYVKNQLDLQPAYRVPTG